MRRTVSLLLSAVILSLAAFDAPPTYAKGFKKYRLKTKKTPVDFVDENFGDHGEKCNIVFMTEAGSRDLLLRVWRELEPDQTAPTLNVIRIRIYGYSSADEVVYEIEVDAGFKIERNESGGWVHEIEALPKRVKKISIIFQGHYESD
jgi:hypothetical protein